LRAADVRDFLDAEQIRRGEQRRVGLGTRNDDAADASNLSGNRRHQQRRNQRKTAARNVTANRFERLDALADAHSGLDDNAPGAGPLLFGNAADVPRGMLECHAQLARNLLRGGAAVPRAYPQRLGRKPQMVQPANPAQKRSVAAAPHAGNNACGHQLGRRVTAMARAQEFAGSSAGEFDDAHQSTILLSGYSTIPCAFAALSRGIK
jgi:hypothetical protein